MNIPSWITLLRLVLLVPVLVGFWWDSIPLILSSLALVIFSDILDGYLARRWGQTTELGKVLDHAVDKVVALSIAGALVLTRGAPLWFFAFLLARELVTCGVGLYLLIKGRRLSGSNFWGKLTGGFFSAGAVAYIIHLETLGLWLWVATVVLALVASVSYGLINLRKKPTGASVSGAELVEPKR